MDKYSIGWSLDEEHIYIDNATLDEREIAIDFVGDSKNFSKDKKIEILETIIAELKA